MAIDASTSPSALAPLERLLLLRAATAGATLSFGPGSRIFAPGDPADTVYLVRAGAVTLEAPPPDGRPRTFGRGLLVGADEALARVPRTSYAVAEGATVLEAYATDAFRFALGLDTALYEQVQAVSRVAALRADLPGRLAWAVGDGRAAIELRLAVRDGASALVRHTPEDLGWEAMRVGDGAGEELERSWQDPHRHLARSLVMRAGRCVALRARGPWHELPAALDHLICGRPIASQLLDRFARSGELEGPSPHAQRSRAVVCHCLRLTRAAIQEARARGATSLASARARTGASSVCGACTARVAEIVGDVLGAPFRLVSELDVAPNIRSFRFAPVDGAPLEPAKAGQHVVLAAKVDDRWVHRSYTLTNPAGDRTVREITVKRERHGELTSWLFDRRPAHPELRLSEPQGLFCPNLSRPEPILFLVGGVGVTPALAAVRTLAAAGSRARLHVDYSARAEDGFACRDELSAIAARHANVTVNFRVTARGDLIGPQSISALAVAHPSAQWFLCGPPGYIASARSALTGIEPRRIHVESFAPDAPTSQLAPPRPLSDRLAFAVGLALLLAYLAQHLFDLRIPALEALQQDQDYRRWSGALLLSFVAAQWLLPGLRLAGRLRAAARVYRWHRYLGAVAPLVLWVHSTHPGFAYLAFLAGIYLVNSAVGLCDKTLVRDSARRERYFRVWLVPHIVLACATSVLALVHLYVVFAYQGAGP